MGAGFVFIVWMIFLAIAAAIAMPICMILARFVGRSLSEKQRRKLFIGFTLLPIVGVIYIAIFFIAMAVWGTVTHRDFGFGDGFTLPLNNQYQFDAIDIPDYAYIYQRSSDINHSLFSGVIELQQNGDWLAGSIAKEDPFNISTERKWTPASWFLFNTRSGEKLEFTSESDLKAAASAHGFELKLQSSEVFYDTYRYKWYDAVVAFLLWLPALIAAVVGFFLTRKWIRAKTAENALAV